MGMWNWLKRIVCNKKKKEKNPKKLEVIMESRVEEIMDSRLNSLPDDIIHKILSTVSMKDVIKTSLLSSRWRYIWTSLPYLNFSTTEWHWREREFTAFVKHVLSRRNNQVPMSSVKLIFHEYADAELIERTIKYILSHNVHQVDVECMNSSQDLDEHWQFSYPDSVTLFSSQSLERLSLTMAHSSRKYLTASSTLELPALTTLYLSHVELYHDDNTLFSKCPNLKNLTLKSCEMKDLDSLSICHHRLSDLTLEHGTDSVKVLNVVAPQLHNLTIRSKARRHQPELFVSRYDTIHTDYFEKYKHLISAPNLISLVYEGYHPLSLSTDGFPSLEKVDLCICKIRQEVAEVLNIVRLFQQIQSVKFLTLNLEILEFLSSSVEIISPQPSPFASLRRLKIYPAQVSEREELKKNNVSTVVVNYLLDGSPKADFTLLTREDIRRTKAAKNLIFELQIHLKFVKAGIKDNTNIAQVENQLQIERNMAYINNCWGDLRNQILHGIGKIEDIVNKLRCIEELLAKLPASYRAEIQPSFSSLCAEADTVMFKHWHTTCRVTNT